MMSGGHTDDATFSLTEALSALERTPAALDALLRALPPHRWQAREAPEAWTPRDVLAHLCWCEIDDWMPRVERILREGASRPFAPFDREGGVARYAGWSGEQLLDEFAARRRQSLEALVACDLRPADLTREGRHPELGTVTLGQLLATWTTHDLGHLAQIARTLVRAHGPHVGPWKKYFSLLQ